MHAKRLYAPQDPRAIRYPLGMCTTLLPMTSAFAFAVGPNIYKLPVARLKTGSRKTAALFVTQWLALRPLLAVKPIHQT